MKGDFMKQKTRMYADVKTWNPFKGCLYDCSYCKPSFQQQAKRQKHNCHECYGYIPHEHAERLNKIPSASTIFVCGNGDISFSSHVYTMSIINAIKRQNKRTPDRTYYFQSKRPNYFEPFVDEFPENVIILTTLETNRDEGYESVSRAPKPSERFRQLRDLKYRRKVITIEPILAFDPVTFIGMITTLEPEYVWFGFNSRPKAVALEEPTKEEVIYFLSELKKIGIRIKYKDMRDIEV